MRTAQVLNENENDDENPITFTIYKFTMYYLCTIE